MQKMMTKEIERKVPRLYATDGQGDDAIAYAHYFSCVNNWDWWMTEYDPDTGEAFGLVKGFAVELGYFSLREFEELNAERGFEVVERDAWWQPKTLGQVKRHSIWGEVCKAIWE